MLLPATSWNNEISCARGSNWTLWSRILRWNFAPFASKLIGSFRCWQQRFQQDVVFAAFESKQNFAEKSCKTPKAFSTNSCTTIQYGLNEAIPQQALQKDLQKGWVLFQQFHSKIVDFLLFLVWTSCRKGLRNLRKKQLHYVSFFPKNWGIDPQREKRPAWPHRPVCGTLSQNGYGEEMQRSCDLIFFDDLFFSPERDVCCCWWHISIVCCGIRHAKLLTSKGSCFTNAVGVSTKWIPCTSTAGFADCHSSVGNSLKNNPDPKQDSCLFLLWQCFLHKISSTDTTSTIVLKFGFFSSFLLPRNSFATLLLRFFTTLSPKFGFDVKSGVEEVVDEERKKGARSFREM